LDPVEAVRAWHDRTKHHPGRYAASAGYLDWESQPEPFRRFVGAPLVPLDLEGPPGPSYEEAWLEGRVPPRALDRASLSQLLRDALGLSAWKQAGDTRWPLRVDPSSGNLHPTEGYLLAPAVEGLCPVPAVWHYQPFLHALEQRRTLTEAEWAALSAGLPGGSVLVGLSSIAWREAWKYGERSGRYCQHDLGHVIGTVAVAAAALGWRVRLVGAATDEELDRLLGLPAGDPAEEERADALLVVGPQVEAGWRPGPIPAGAWVGTPNRLSTEHHPWPVLELLDRVTRKEVAGPAPERVEVDSGLVVGDSPVRLREIVHMRRSAVDMDGRTGISRAAFVQVLRKLLPGRAQVPWTALPWAPRVHPVFFVHRVQDVAPGLYMLVRDPAALPRLRGWMDPAFDWEQTAELPELPGLPELPLYRLRAGDMRAVAQSLSCGQGIASDGVFAVAMLGELRGTLEQWGAWAWKRLHWEAGLLGQVLYLEAEATGIRGTGIGCFFDDPTHHLLLRAEAWREDRLVDLYHFTVGGPVEDGRLQTLPAYAHRDEALAQEG